MSHDNDRTAYPDHGALSVTELKRRVELADWLFSKNMLKLMGSDGRGWMVWDQSSGLTIVSGSDANGRALSLIPTPT